MVDRVRGRAHLQPPIVFGRGAAGGRQPLTCFGRAPVWGRDLGRGLAKRPPHPHAPRAPPLRAPRPALARPAPRPHAPRAPPSRAPRPALTRPAPRPRAPRAPPSRAPPPAGARPGARAPALPRHCADDVRGPLIRRRQLDARHRVCGHVHPAHGAAAACNGGRGRGRRGANPSPLCWRKRLKASACRADGSPRAAAPLGRNAADAAWGWAANGRGQKGRPQGGGCAVPAPCGGVPMIRGSGRAACACHIPPPHPT
jgi:hypothetical protein